MTKVAAPTLDADDVSRIAVENDMSREEVERTLAQLDRLEKMLDRQFGVPGLRFGWDSIIGLVPGFGDAFTSGLSGYLIWKAHKLGAPRHLKAKMAANAGLDFAVGFVPLVGDVADAFFKANTKNVRLLKAHLHETHGVERSVA